MNKKTLCLIGLLFSANSFAQSAPASQAKSSIASAKSEAVNKKDPKKKGFSVKTITIKPSKDGTLEKVSNKDYEKNIKAIEKAPEFVKKQESPKVKSANSGSEKIFSPNITNLTMQDIKNDPTLKSNAVFEIKQESKPSISVLDEYNQRRQNFLKKKEQTQKALEDRKKVVIQERSEYGKLIRARDEYRKSLGLPISRFENNKGSENTEAGISREVMSIMNNSPVKMPTVPPTGNVMPVPQR